MVQIRDMISEELENALAGKKTPQAALDDAVPRGNTMLRQFERTAALAGPLVRPAPCGGPSHATPAPARST